MAKCALKLFLALAGMALYLEDSAYSQHFAFALRFAALASVVTDRNVP
jgi:hypothetical protein